jgi:hypothetical protein
LTSTEKTSSAAAVQMVNLIFALLYIYHSCAVPWYRGKSKVQIVGNLTKYCDIGVAIAGPATPTLRYRFTKGSILRDFDKIFPLVKSIKTNSKSTLKFELRGIGSHLPDPDANPQKSYEDVFRISNICISPFKNNFLRTQIAQFILF